MRDEAYFCATGCVTRYDQSALAALAA